VARASGVMAAAAAAAPTSPSGFADRSSARKCRAAANESRIGWSAVGVRALCERSRLVNGIAVSDRRAASAAREASASDA